MKLSSKLTAKLHDLYRGYSEADIVSLRRKFNQHPSRPGAIIKITARALKFIYLATKIFSFFKKQDIISIVKPK